MRVYSIFGVYRSGFLHGRAREAAEELIHCGQIIACQGPEAPNSATGVVTLLSRPRDNPTAPWSAYGKITLHDEPQFPERIIKTSAALPAGEVRRALTEAAADSELETVLTYLED